MNRWRSTSGWHVHVVLFAVMAVPLSVPVSAQTSTQTPAQTSAQTSSPIPAQAVPSSVAAVPTPQEIIDALQVHPVSHLRGIRNLGV